MTKDVERLESSMYSLAGFKDARYDVKGGDLRALPAWPPWRDAGCLGRVVFNIWNSAHIGKRGHDVAFEHLCVRPYLIENKIRWERAGFRWRLDDVAYSVDNELGRLSSLGDLFSSLEICR